MQFRASYLSFDFLDESVKKCLIISESWFNCC